MHILGFPLQDLINSELGYLGFFDSESYGLTWKVRGFCKDLSNPEVFDTTNVYGDIIGCDIHHNYYGHYTYGHEGGVWTNNKMHDNHQYGFDPHDDSDYLTIADNEVYNNFNHGEPTFKKIETLCLAALAPRVAPGSLPWLLPPIPIPASYLPRPAVLLGLTRHSLAFLLGIIASKRCNNVKIYNNVIRDGGPEAAGIFLHRSSDYAEVYGNTITNMQVRPVASHRIAPHRTASHRIARWLLPARIPAANDNAQ